jgi:hypothetical protein
MIEKNIDVYKKLSSPFTIDHRPLIGIPDEVPEARAFSYALSRNSRCA